VEKEVPLGQGKAVDLVVTKGDGRTAIEVETGKSDVEANLRKCADAGFDRTVIAPTFKRGGRILRAPSRKDAKHNPRAS